MAAADGVHGKAVAFSNCTPLITGLPSVTAPHHLRSAGGYNPQTRGHRRLRQAARRSAVDKQA
eukprot:5112164-Pyramimonas_sp.AAC.1